MQLTLITALISTTLSAGTTLLLATLGEIYTERAGVLNLGVEGMMLVGAVTGFGTTVITNNPWIGILVGAIAGGLLSLIHGFMSITLRANQVVSGLALTLFGLGLSSLLGRDFIGVSINYLRPIPIPFLSDLPVIGSTLFNLSPIIYFAILITIPLWYILFRTKIGIIIRSVGENPAAADALGINVYLVRYLCVLLGGILAGLAGAYLSVSFTLTWIEGMTAGRGWIAVALTIFSMWSPLRALVGAYFFGLLEVLQFYLQPLGIPPNFLQMLPYLFTIIVLIFVSGKALRKRIGAPESLMEPYER